MKFISFIGAFYILALTLVPCADYADKEHCNDQSNQTEGSHEHDENGKDDCSPLCFCNCCHVHMNISTANFVFDMKEELVDGYTSYQTFIPDSPVKNLLRPPRV